jgi:hypothetical protein
MVGYCFDAIQNVRERDRYMIVVVGNTSGCHYPVPVRCISLVVEIYLKVGVPAGYPSPCGTSRVPPGHTKSRRDAPREMVHPGTGLLFFVFTCSIVPLMYVLLAKYTGYSSIHDSS